MSLNAIHFNCHNSGAHASSSHCLQLVVDSSSWSASVVLQSTFSLLSQLKLYCTSCLWIRKRKMLCIGGWQDDQTDLRLEIWAIWPQRAKLVKIFDLMKQLLKQLQEMLETNRNFDEENLLVTRLGYLGKWLWAEVTLLTETGRSKLSFAGSISFHFWNAKPRIPLISGFRHAEFSLNLLSETGSRSSLHSQSWNIQLKLFDKNSLRVHPLSPFLSVSFALLHFCKLSSLHLCIQYYKTMKTFVSLSLALLCKRNPSGPDARWRPRSFCWHHFVLIPANLFRLDYFTISKVCAVL